MKRIITLTLAALAMFVFAFVAGAAQTKLYTAYEDVRQALLGDSLDDVQRTAKELAAAAAAEKQKAIAERASALAAAADLEAARDSFAELSDEVIRFRDGRSGARPDVVYCAMEKKSWLQPKGAITNPYAPAMRSCGEVRKDTSPAAPSHDHHHH